MLLILLESIEYDLTNNVKTYFGQKMAAFRKISWVKLMQVENFLVFWSIQVPTVVSCVLKIPIT